MAGFSFPHRAGGFQRVKPPSAFGRSWHGVATIGADRPRHRSDSRRV